MPHAAMLALQGLVDVGEIRAGQRVLLNGAGGGVGMFAIQLARLHGAAEVTGVDSGDKAGMMRDLGFDHVIDFRREDFTRNGRRYDLILDAKTTRWPFSYLRSLAPGATYATVGGHLDRLFAIVTTGRLLRALTKKTLRVVALKPNQGLAELGELFEAGKLRCVVDGPYTLGEVPNAVQYFGDARHEGKVVIRVSAG